MRSLLTLTILICSLVSYSQSKKLTGEQINASGAHKLLFTETLQDAIALARQDNDNNIPFLLLQGGIAPVAYSTDSAFEDKYKVTYFDYGCNLPNLTFTIEYNKVIFEYLNKKYGVKWMKEVRKDVLGLKEFKRDCQ